jgi:hypothetical protein
MDKAPERIWVQNDTKDHREELSEMAVEPVPEVTSCFQGYTRTDISTTLIAAAYEAAGDACDNVAKSYDVLKADRETYEPPRVQMAAKSMVRIASEDVRALTPDDARAAYDAAIRAAKIEGMREAGKAIEDAGYYCIPPYEGTGNLDQQITYSNDAITALIEETEKGGNKHGPLRTTKNTPIKGEAYHAVMPGLSE